MYTGLLLGHVLAATVWVGGGVMMQILARRARSAGSPDALTGFATQAAWVGTRVFMPASILTFLFGVALVVKGGYGFGTTWIAIGVAGYLVALVNGAALLGPTGRKLRDAVEAKGASDPETRTLAQRLIALMSIDAVVVVLVVADMVLKPGA